MKKCLILMLVLGLVMGLWVPTALMEDEPADLCVPVDDEVAEVVWDLGEYFIAESPTAQPAEEPAPVEEPAPAEEPVSVEESEPVEESAPVEEPAPAEESAQVEEPAPAEESAQVEESAPIEETAPVADAAEAPVETEPTAAPEGTVAVGYEGDCRIGGTVRLIARVEGFEDGGYALRWQFCEDLSQGEPVWRDAPGENDKTDYVLQINDENAAYAWRVILTSNR